MMMTRVVTPRSQIPGARFTPKDLELVKYLRKRITEGKSCSFITYVDIYEKVPWLVQHVRHFRSKENVWYYFGTRDIKKEDSKKASRRVGLGLTWKNNNSDPIKENGVKIGSIHNFSFLDKGKATGWVMREFLLDISNKHVLYKILFHPSNQNARYAPTVQPRVIGKPQPSPREEGLREDNQKNDPVVTHLRIEQQQQQLSNHLTWNGSCPGEAVSYSTAQHQQFKRHVTDSSNFRMNEGMEQQQDFGFRQDSSIYASQRNMNMTANHDFCSSTQSSEGDLDHNQASLDPMQIQQCMEPHQDDNSSFDHNVVEKHAREHSYLTQEQKQPCKKTTNLHAELLGESLGGMDATASVGIEEVAPQLEENDEMANFGDAEWAKQLGKNTPEEEAELMDALGRCKTVDSIFNYLCAL